jgi:hypothetical protein
MFSRFNKSWCAAMAAACANDTSHAHNSATHSALGAYDQSIAGGSYVPPGNAPRPRDGAVPIPSGPTGLVGPDGRGGI